MLLRVEDFFGHAQYGIAAGRPLADDYHAGDEVLIADGVNAARANVSAHRRRHGDGASGIGQLVRHAGGGMEDSNTPSRCQLPKTPTRRGCFRMAAATCASTGLPARHITIGGGWTRNGTLPAANSTAGWSSTSPMHRAIWRSTVAQWIYPKDYVEYHQVVRAYTSHLIERYGDACLEFVWSVFNEPDLAVAFWRGGDWIELQKFYDYTVDAILRSFEDHGYDSSRVIVGGLEIGGIFGTHIEGPILKTFLGHCSPTATCEGELEQNAALADTRLDGQRSKRVEDLGRTTGGKGSPCDFISVHSYNAAPLMAAKLRRAKELASGSRCGLLSRICGSVPSNRVRTGHRRPMWLRRTVTWATATSPRGVRTWPGGAWPPRPRMPATARGETLLTFWPWPNSNFRGHNNATQVISVDDDGDGKKDRDESVALPILHFLGLLARMGDDYWVLPEQTIGGHVVSGFASRQDDALFVLVYTHDQYDIQARSQAEFHISLDLSNLPWSEVSVREYRFDKDHNSYFHAARELRDRPAKTPDARRPSADEVAQMLADLTSGDRNAQLAASAKGSWFQRPAAGSSDRGAAASRVDDETRKCGPRSKRRAAGSWRSRSASLHRTSHVSRNCPNCTLPANRHAAVDPDGTVRLPVWSLPMARTSW